MSDEVELDIPSLIKRLAPDQLGLFEPLSGMMLLNVEEDAFLGLAKRWSERVPTDEDVRLIATINHETYHFAQTAASGFMHERQRAAFRVFNESPPPEEPELDPELRQIFDVAREQVGDDPEAQARLERSLYIVMENARQEQLEARAAPGDHSVAGPTLPDFFAFLDRRHAEEATPNAHGVSILGIIEGSAVIFANRLTYGAEAAPVRIKEELATLPPVYAELLDFTTALVGDRALEVALPAVALALCYAAPHDAYCALVPLIAAAPEGEALARGRGLSEAPPALAAGAWLGDSLAQRALDDSYRIYDAFLDGLRSDRWGVDSYALLADPPAMERIGLFPMGLLTRTSWRGSVERYELIARMFVMGTVLKSVSRRREQREFEKLKIAWAQDVLGRFMQ